MSIHQALFFQSAAVSNKLFSWGENVYGQLGIGNTSNRSSPVQVGTDTIWRSVAGFDQTIAVKTNNTLWAWGRGSEGQLGNGTTTVIVSTPVQIGSLTNWSKSTASYQLSFAIKTDGTLWAWGSDADGALGTGDLTNYSSPVQIGSQSYWSDIEAASNVTDGRHVVAIGNSGRLYSWGTNLFGQLGLNDTIDYSSPVQVGSLTNWSIVAKGPWGLFNLAIKTNGSLWAIGGYNGSGQLALGDTTERSSPIQIGSLTTWAKVSKGNDYAAAIKTDGTLWTWGGNASGQLGLGNTTNYSSPVQVGSLTNWKDVICTERSTYAIKTDGTIWSWGYNTSGELGLGNTTALSSPAQIGALSSWDSVSCGKAGGFAITK